MSTIPERVSWRRAKIAELLCQGFSQRQVATALGVSTGTVSSDANYLRKQAAATIQSYIEEELPHQHNLAILSLTKLQSESWIIFSKSEDPRIRLQALSLIKDVTMAKQQILGDPAMIMKAVETVSRVKHALDNPQPQAPVSLEYLEPTDTVEVEQS